MQASGRPEKFGRWRAVEIKHGRVAMMATTGELTHTGSSIQMRCPLPKASTS
jgi:hypothetical protein